MNTFSFSVEIILWMVLLYMYLQSYRGSHLCNIRAVFTELGHFTIVDSQIGDNARLARIESRLLKLEQPSDIESLFKSLEAKLFRHYQEAELGFIERIEFTQAYDKEKLGNDIRRLKEIQAAVTEELLEILKNIKEALDSSFRQMMSPTERNLLNIVSAGWDRMHNVYLKQSLWLRESLGTNE